VAQRTKTLTAKLVIHEQARAFYMPTFTPPVEDATMAAEKVPLHLPSSLSEKLRTRHCRPALIQAELEIRFAGLGDALADLTRHLRTRTLLLRFKAKQATGVRTNTRLRDSVAGVSRRVDAAAAGYRRHRHAYKALAGPGEWEKTYRHLSGRDVRGLSERSVSDRELEERYLAKKLTDALRHVQHTPDLPSAEDVAEDAESDDEDEEFIDDLAPLANAARLLAEDVAPGEGRRKISWIWTSGLQVDDVNDVQLTDGMFGL
jgi:hypothetical protein